MFENVVLALDGSDQSDDALAYATEIARDHGSKLHVVHVVEVLVGRGGGMLQVNEREIKTRIPEHVHELREAGIDADLEFRSAVVGRCGNVIARVAAEHEADVIITGSRQHSGLAGMLLGSVTQRLLHLADCPVLIIPRGSARKVNAHARGRDLAGATV
jgi:nucleotide-binding universal stress UspA family protein